jgi:parvulin-like peptidyl-prolyl isomerase
MKFHRKLSGTLFSKNVHNGLSAALFSVAIQGCIVTNGPVKTDADPDLATVDETVAGTTLASDAATDENQIILSEAMARLDDMGPQGQAIKNNANQRAAFVQDMTRTRRLAKAAEKAGLDKDPRFRQRLAAQREHILAVMFTDRYLDKKMTESALKKFYSQNRDLFTGEERRAFHIVTTTETTAKAAIAAMQEANANLEILKKEFAASAPAGTTSGDLGFFARGQMLKGIEEAAFATEPGTVHPVPVQSEFGWHAIKVTASKPAKVSRFEDARDEVVKRYRAMLHTNLIRNLDHAGDVQKKTRQARRAAR